MKPTKQQIKANRKKWAAALRSGKYKQCRHKMYDGIGFCCLGVAAVVVCKLPAAILSDKGYGAVRRAMGYTHDHQTAFINANDYDRKRFKTIAKMVDALPDPT